MIDSLRMYCKYVYGPLHRVREGITTPYKALVLSSMECFALAITGITPV